MNILVCIKQVPDTTDIRIDPETNTLIREGVESIINPFDMYAIEEAIRLRERYTGKVVAISMGPPQVEAALRETVAMGVDEIILLSDRKFAGADTWATSLTIAKALEHYGDFDLVLTGQQAIDGDTAQVGPGIASHLHIPQVCFVRKVEAVEGNKVTVQRLMEDGYDRVEMSMPAVISVVKEINEPRLPSLKGKRKAKKIEMTVWDAATLGLDEKDIGLNGSPTQVVEIFAPNHSKTGDKLEAAAPVLAEAIISKLQELSK